MKYIQKRDEFVLDFPRFAFRIGMRDNIKFWVVLQFERLMLENIHHASESWHQDPMA